MGLVDELTDKRVCIDTAPFIYYIENHQKYAKVLKSFFLGIHSGNIDAITTTVTLLEVLVHPYRTGNTKLADRYRDILLHSEGLTTLEITHEVSERAARLRAKYSIKTPDAIQISASVVYGAETVVTNDSGLKQISEIEVLCLDDFVSE